MGNRTSRDSSSQKLYKVLSGKEDYTISTTGDSQSFETTLSVDDFLVARFFARIDGEERLFALPIKQYAGEPPQWISVTKNIQFYMWGLDGAINLIVLNLSGVSHVISLEYLIYRSAV